METPKNPNFPHDDALRKNLSLQKPLTVIIPAVCAIALAIVTALLLSSSPKNKTTTSDAHDPYVTFLSGTPSIIVGKKLSFTNFDCQHVILTPNDFAAVHFPRMRYLAELSNSQSCGYAPEYTIGIPPMLQLLSLVLLFVKA